MDRAQVDLLTLINVEYGGEAALFVARISPSAGSYASSSVRVGSVGFVRISLTVFGGLKVVSKHSKRLGASVTNSHGWGDGAVVTPLGPAQSLAPAGGTQGVNPANGPWPLFGANCVTTVGVLALRVSTDLLERSAR